MKLELYITESSKPLSATDLGILEDCSLYGLSIATRGYQDIARPWNATINVSPSGQFVILEGSADSSGMGYAVVTVPIDKYSDILEITIEPRNHEDYLTITKVLTMANWKFEWAMDDIEDLI